MTARLAQRTPVRARVFHGPIGESGNDAQGALGSGQIPDPE